MKHLTLIKNTLLILVFLAGLLQLSEQDAWSAKKPVAKSQISAVSSSSFGSFKVRLTNAKGSQQNKTVKAGVAKTITIPAGTKVALVTKPKAGYKAAILVDGELVKFQKDNGKALITSAAKAPKIVELIYNYKLPKVTISSTTPTTPRIEARFAKKGEPFSKEAGIVFSGLGSSIKVTNQSPVNLAGTAFSDVGVKSVSWTNETTGATGLANGTKDWQVALPLNTGDNQIKVALTAKDGTTFSNNTVLTHFPGIDFNTPLNTSQNVLFVGPAQAVRFNIGLSNPTDAVVSLIETDATGVALSSPATPMLDNGLTPDEIDEDGLFSASKSIDTTSGGYKYYRAKVEKPGQTYFSETLSIWITTPFTSEQIKAAVDLADNASTRFAALLASGNSELQAATTILAEIKALPIVGSAGVSDSNALWWVTQDGILGGFEPPRPNQKGGADGGSQEVIRKAENQQYFNLIHTAGNLYHSDAELTPRYTQEQMVNYVYVPGKQVMMSSLAATTDDNNRTGSHNSIIISPFINNPNSGANFGTSDDLYGPWEYLKTNGSICTQTADKSVVNDGSVNVGFGDFKDLSDYGLIHISTHGNTLYNGLLSTWNDVWGSNEFLKGYYSLVVLASGVYLPKNTDGTFDTATVSADLRAKRIAVFPTGGVYMLPEFFRRYLGQLPRSLVFLSACRAAYNRSMVDVFLAKGANAVFGFSEYVDSGYAKNVTNEMYTKLIGEDKTFKEGLTSATSKFGATDTSTPPAAPLIFGNADAKRSSGNLVNGSFEDGRLSPWKKQGDGRVISRLGHFTPTTGTNMGIISTGLGFTTDSGSISQSFCLPTDATKIKFSWNFNSEEFKEFCNTGFQDNFQVQLCEVDPKTGAELSCTTLFFQTIDALCASVVGVTFRFDRGGVFTTGWLNATLPVLPATLAGKSVKLKFSAGDIGDSIYDTAVLLDDISIDNSAL